MLLKVISQERTNGYDEIDIITQDIEYISDTKKARFLGANGKAYRLTAKSFTELNKVLKRNKVV